MVWKEVRREWRIKDSNTEMEVEEGMGGWRKEGSWKVKK